MKPPPFPASCKRGYAPAPDSSGPRRTARALGVLGCALCLGHAAQAQTILDSAAGYAVMAGSTVTIGGVNSITGDLGAANLAGAGSYTHTGALVSPITAQNQTDFTRAFNGLAAMTPTQDLTGLILGTSAGATTLTPGVYHFNSTAQLTGTLILDAQNQANAVWVFQIGSTFTTTAGAAVTFANLAENSATTNGLFWQIGTATSIGANTTLEGNLLGGSTFDFGSGATLNQGRVLTATGTITLAGNTIDFLGANSGYSGGLAFIGSGSELSAIPEPATYAAIIGAAVLVVAGWQRRRQRKPAVPGPIAAGS